jgi:hypothetical protein
MNNQTSKNLIVTFGLIAIFLFTANHAQAYVPGVWDPQPRVYTQDQSMFTTVPVVNRDSVVNLTTTSSTNNTTSANSGQQAINTNKAITTNQVARSTTNTSNVPLARAKPNTVTNTATTGFENLPAVTTTPSSVDTTSNDLTALSLRGSGSFMPSSLWQWMIVVILILLIIILARMLTRGHIVHHYEDNNHGAPAHH